MAVQMTLRLSALFILFSFSKGDDSLQQIISDTWEWRMRMNPQFATRVGDHRYDHLLFNYTLAAHDANKVEAEGFYQRLNDFSTDGLSKADLRSYTVLKASLMDYISGHEFARYGAVNPINFLEGIHIQANKWINSMVFNSSASYDKFETRMRAYVVQLGQVIELMQYAIRQQRTYNNASVAKVPGAIDAVIANGHSGTDFWAPYDQILDDLNGIDAAKKTEIRNRGANIINQEIIPKLQELKQFIVTEYMPATRTASGVASWTGGADYYRACLRWHLSTDMTPQQIHQTGLDEVKRIMGLMEGIKNKVGNESTPLKEFLQNLKTQPQFFYQTEDELLDGYKEIVLHKIPPKLPALFELIPNNTVVVRRMPYDGPIARYLDPSADGKKPGVFLANTRNPETKPKFEMPSLSLHETSPGHHLQTTYMLSAGLPLFRRVTDYTMYFSVPFHFPFNTAYSEGWGLYAELLGEEMPGMYETDYELLGRYSQELFRAARLVVDTGLHYYNWTSAEAQRYILERTTMGASSVRSEIERYMTWPGQACAYKIGEIRIVALRRKAERRLGNKFDLKKFHTVVLDTGSAPLQVLEAAIDSWIDEQIGTTSGAPMFMATPLMLLIVFFSL